MNFRLKTKIFVSLLALVFFIPLASVLAQTPSKGACDGFGSNFVLQLSNGTQTDVISGLPKICSAQTAIGNVITILLEFAALIAVLFIMIGGFWYLTAAGNEEQSEKGQKTLTSAIIGLVVIILAFALVRITANFLTSTVAGGGASTSSSSGSSSGSGATTPSGSTGSPSGTTAPPVDPNNMFAGLTQTDLDGGNNTAPLAATIVTGFRSLGAAGVSVTSTILPSNKQALAAAKVACGSTYPPFMQVKLVLDGSAPTDYANDTYKKAVSGNWVAAVNDSTLIGAATKIQIFVCNSVVATEDVPKTPPIR